MRLHNRNGFIHEALDIRVFRFGRFGFEFLGIHFVVFYHATDIGIVEFRTRQGRHFIHHPLMLCIQAVGKVTSFCAANAFRSPLMAAWSFTIIWPNALTSSRIPFWAASSPSFTSVMPPWAAARMKSLSAVESFVSALAHGTAMRSPTAIRV